MSLINQTNVRAFALAVARSDRTAAGFTRVSKEFLDRIEFSVRAKIKHEVWSQPSNGKTIK
jgi:hypothetical protein